MNNILLIGSGRSGTSFFQRIFDSHPDTFNLHEPDIVIPRKTPPFLVAPEDYAALKDSARTFIISA